MLINKNFTILVVDDVDDMIELVSHMLRKAGYQVVTATNARLAMRIMESQPIDLAIFDINMPLVDGINLLKLVRHDPETRFIPVIMLTALDDCTTTVECLRNGACGYITKPFNMKGLLGQIDNCIARPA